MKIRRIVLFFLGIISCDTTPPLPKPKAELSLEYPKAEYQLVKNICAFRFLKNDNAQYEDIEGCESKLVYSKMNATLFLSYRPVENNIDALVSEAYKMPSSHIRQATRIPERIFQNPDHKSFGTLFRIEGNAASQVQFFLTDSTEHFLAGALYFYARPNYDSILPAARYIERDIVKLMESLCWE